MKIAFQIVPAMTSSEVAGRNLTEDDTCSFICRTCKTRNWLSGSFHHYNHSLIECPDCKKIVVHPYLRREEILDEPDPVKEVLIEALEDMLNMYTDIQPAGGYQGIYENAMDTLKRAKGE